MVAHKTEKVWKKCFPNLVLNLVTSFESCHESCHESCPVWDLMCETGLKTEFGVILTSHHLAMWQSIEN